MKSPDYDRNRLLALLGEAMDGTLDETATAALNDLLASSAAARQVYREQMHLHARLHLEYSRSRASKFMPGIEPAIDARPARGAAKHWKFATLAAAAAIALLAVAVWPKAGPANGFATLESERAARWAGSDLPTSTGARLGNGTLILTDGLATIRFDSGAVISLEAPATLDLIDAMTCRLHTGTAVANVPESAIGFRIDTPSASVVDYGTRFAVSVEPETGGTLTQVFDGMVKVKQPTTGNVVELRTGQRSKVSGQDMEPPTEGIWERVFPHPAGLSSRGPDWTRLVAYQDDFVGPSLVTDSDILLYVKNGEPGFHRKAYLGFDLAGLGSEQIREAELILHLAPTGLGLASHVADSTFRVYGLLDPDATWSEGHLGQRNAPANIRDSGAELIEGQALPLGTFQVDQGIQHGRVALMGDTLADFLRERAGSQVTLVVVRETPELEKNGLIHGFASRRHPMLPGPYLSIRTEGD